MTRHCTLPEPWRSLANAVGGVGVLAVMVEAAPRSIHAWAHQDQLPHWRTREAIEKVFDLYGIRRPVWIVKR